MIRDNSSRAYNSRPALCFSECGPEKPRDADKDERSADLAGYCFQCSPPVKWTGSQPSVIHFWHPAACIRICACACIYICMCTCICICTYMYMHCPILHFTGVSACKRPLGSAHIQRPDQLALTAPTRLLKVAGRLPLPSTAV